MTKAEIKLIIKHRAKPVAKGINTDTKVQKVLPVSRLIDIQVVEQGK